MLLTRVGLSSLEGSRLSGERRGLGFSSPAPLGAQGQPPERSAGICIGRLLTAPRSGFSSLVFFFIAF